MGASRRAIPLRNIHFPSLDGRGQGYEFLGGVIMKRLLRLFLIICLFPAVSSFAADPGTVLQEVVVTATRHEEKLGSVPANVTVITERDIKNSPALNVPELLRNQAGVQVYDISGNRRVYTVDLRGFGESATSNVLVLVDG